MKRSGEENSESAQSPFSPAENLCLRAALDRGLTLVLKKLTSQLETYSSLLEEDADNNLETRTNLTKINNTLESFRFWLNAHNSALPQKHPTDRESIDATSLISGATRRCQKVLQDRCSLEMPAPPEPVSVRGDMFELQESIMRSILGGTNCLLPEEDKIILETKTRELDNKYFDLFGSTCKGGSYLQVRLRKENIEPANLSQKPFIETLAVSQNLPAVDNVLDLLEMYSILLDHGGDAIIEKKDSAFCALTLFLPVEGTYEEIGVTRSAEDSSLYGNETVLLVDDQDMIWDVIIDLLQDLGYTVILAADGAEAVEIYSENQKEIDLVLLDMVMPEMDGRTAFFRLQELDPEVKVLLHSAYVSEDDIRDVLAAGAVGFLQKPYRIAELARKIRGIFGFSEQNEKETSA